jgi:hypothetical protein
MYGYLAVAARNFGVANETNADLPLPVGMLKGFVSACCCPTGGQWQRGAVERMPSRRWTRQHGAGIHAGRKAAVWRDTLCLAKYCECVRGAIVRLCDLSEGEIRGALVCSSQGSGMPGKRSCGARACRSKGERGKEEHCESALSNHRRADTQLMPCCSSCGVCGKHFVRRIQINRTGKHRILQVPSQRTQIRIWYRHWPAA